MQRHIVVLLFFTFCGAYSAESNYSASHYTVKKNSPAHKVGRFVGEIIVDALRLNLALFSCTSAKIITGITPFYLITRKHDEQLQHHFYDPSCHKNICQLPKGCHQAAKTIVGIPMVGLSSLAVFAHDKDLRTTARIFAIGLPFVHSGKDCIKKIKTKACLRPWHEDFDKEKRSPGGFPSGHMANVTYMTALFGMRFGWKWAVPLGSLASFVFIDFLTCNRHYLSQLVAGIGLGLLYAFAAQDVIEKKLNENFSLSVIPDDQGGICCKASYQF